MHKLLAISLVASLAACSGSSTPSGSTGSASTSGSGTTGASSSGSTGTSSTGGSGGSTGGVPPGGKRIFLTSSTYEGGALGGVSGADQKCTLSAQAVGLSGTWIALVSGLDRISDVGPWYLLDGTKVFNNKAGLSTTPFAVISIDERGGAHAGDEQAHRKS